MKQIDVVSNYRNSVFSIIGGTHIGKKTKAEKINYIEEYIITKTQERIPVDFLRPELLPIPQISDVMAIAIYDIYFPRLRIKEAMLDSTTISCLGNNGLFYQPTVGDIQMIINGRIFCNGAFEETFLVCDYCFKNSIDIFLLINKGLAVLKK